MGLARQQAMTVLPSAVMDLLHTARLQLSTLQLNALDLAVTVGTYIIHARFGGGQSIGATQWWSQVTHSGCGAALS
jgi:hypothetical protein